MRVRARGLTLLLAGCLLATGCGDDDTTATIKNAPAGTTATAPAAASSTPHATVRGYFNALARGDGAKACTLLTRAAQGQAVATVQTTRKKRFESCGQALTTVAADVSKGSLQEAVDVKITQSTVDGGRATVRVAGGSGDIELRRVAGRWYIADGIG